MNDHATLRTGQTATLLPDGRVLISWAGNLPFADIHNPGADTLIHAGPRLGFLV